MPNSAASEMNSPQPQPKSISRIASSPRRPRVNRSMPRTCCVFTRARSKLLAGVSVPCRRPNSRIAASLIQSRKRISFHSGDRIRLWNICPQLPHLTSSQVAPFQAGKWRRSPRIGVDELTHEADRVTPLFYRDEISRIAADTFFSDHELRTVRLTRTDHRDFAYPPDRAQDETALQITRDGKLPGALKPVERYGMT